MDGEVDFTQTLVERFTAYHRRSSAANATAPNAAWRVEHLRWSVALREGEFIVKNGEMMGWLMV